MEVNLSFIPIRNEEIYSKHSGFNDKILNENADLYNSYERDGPL